MKGAAGVSASKSNGASKKKIKANGEGKQPTTELTEVRDLIERVLKECPQRRPASDQERRSQMIFKEHFKRQLGLDSTEHSFRFNENLYANMALHFGLGTLGTAVSGVAPLAGLALHLLAGGSYYADSTRRGYFLRRVFPWKASQNLVTTVPAKGEMKLRLVFMAHADAAFTGFIFDPKVVKNASGDLPPQLNFLKRGLATATKSQFVLAGFDALRLAFGPLTWPLRPIEWLLTIPAIIAFATNLQVVLRNEIVPGANDNLSGCAALPVLASRLIDTVPDDVELCFVITGCEETSLGGADHLRMQMEESGQWKKHDTVIVGLDGLANGELRYLHPEGEVVETPVPNWLKSVVDKAARSESRFNEVTEFAVPVGGSDIAAFLAHGWDGVCLACVDPEFGSPEFYHTPDDTLENLDVEKVMYSIDFAEKLGRAIIAERLPK